MKKIVFIGSLRGGGKERRMCELIRYLYQLKTYELYLLSIDDGVSNEIVYSYVLNCLHGYKLIDRKCSRINTYKSVGRLLDEIRPDIVHDWVGYRTGIYLLPKLICRKFYYIVGYIADGNKDSFFHSLIYKLIYAFSDKIISNSWAGIISHKVPKSKAQVIYNGFNPDRLPLGDSAVKLRDELLLGDNKVVSMAARLTPAKDYIMFLNVALRVQQSGSNVIFLIIGCGLMEASLKKYMKEHDIRNVKFLGFRKDVLDLLKLSDVTLLCSNNEIHCEGVSNSIMESMACGTPVIATNGGGTSEIIENGKNGFIVTPHDYETMSSILFNLLNDKSLMLRLSSSALQTVQDKFSIQKMVEKYIEIYENH